MAVGLSTQKRNYFAMVFCFNLYVDNATIGRLTDIKRRNTYAKR
jgi:hypothetical protein